MIIRIHTKSLITSVPVTQYIMPNFQQKSTMRATRKTQPEEKKKVSKHDLDYDIGLGIIRQRGNISREIETPRVKRKF